jgi:nicotinate-nucleotide adenylyltransferase
VVRAALDSHRYRQLRITVSAQTAPKSQLAQFDRDVDRLAMVRAAWGHLPTVFIDDREIRRGGMTFTIDTVRELLDEGLDPLELIVGADSANSLDRWSCASELRDLVSVAVVPRPGAIVAVPAGWRWRMLDMPEVDLSSRQIRQLDPRVAATYLDDAVIPLYLDLHG